MDQEIYLQGKPQKHGRFHKILVLLKIVKHSLFNIVPGNSICLKIYFITEKNLLILYSKSNHSFLRFSTKINIYYNQKILCNIMILFSSLSKHR